MTEPALLDTAPEKSAALGRSMLVVGLVVGGAGAYVYLVLAARALGPARFSSLSNLWVVLNILGPGLFAPLEIETSRAISHRAALGLGGLPVLQRTIRMAGWLSLFCAAALGIASEAISSSLFDGSLLMVLWTALIVVAVAAASISRGVFASTHRLGRYGAQLTAESALRACAAALALALGSRSPALFGLILVLALVLAVLATCKRPSAFLEDGPPVESKEVSKNLALLLAGALLSYALLNSGPLIVSLASDSSSRSSAGVLLAGLQVARVPLFLFAAISIVLLPHLAAAHARRDLKSFRTVLRRVLLGLTALGVAGTTLGGTLGPWVIRTFFGSGFILSHKDLALLCAGSAFYMLCLAYGQALIAVEAFREAALAWLIGIAGLAILSASVANPTIAVEWGFAAGSLLTLVASALLLQHRLLRLTTEDDRSTEASVRHEATGRPAIKPKVRLGWTRSILALAIVANLTAGIAVADTQSDQPPAGIVSRVGNHLELNGKTWRFTGLDAYQLATDYRYSSGCGPEVDDPDALFDALAPGSVVRLWAFQAFAVDNGKHIFNWLPLDRAVAAAQRRGIKLIMVLSNQSGTCDDGEWHGSDWYSGGYRQEFNVAAGAPQLVSWWTWMHMIVSRYAASTAVAYWEPVNEPEASDCAAGINGESCYGHTTCPADAAAVLKGFFDVVGRVIRSIDRWHPIGSGTLGGNQCGSAGPSGSDWATVGSSPGIDVLTVHDYSGSYATATSGGILARSRQAADIGKPLVMEEVGRTASPASPAACDTTTERATKFTDYAGHMFQAAHLAGFLAWQWLGEPHPECSDAVSSTDPLIHRFGDLESRLDK